ncbi:sensor histidine kinase [Sediminicola luteus]|uniref:histidine kinase n=1 Tax=Sediminicola luteus TaxID=319238 RepID=A0A2A4GEQ2_9FLAO|nr:HAMP domain-containing sensor histidine kinase [Sediminicola luteus]PCE66488.1 two-component sensor histidine kinase [Sediminicola luteus]
MILLVLIASVLIFAVTIYQYREQAKDYHRAKLERKELQIKQSIDNVIRATSYEVRTDNVPHIFREEIYRISDVLNVSFNMYDLKGHLLISSSPRLENDSIAQQLDAQILDGLKLAKDERYVEKLVAAGDNYQAAYRYITDTRFKPIAILNLPYYEDNSFTNKELKEFLGRLSLVYILMFALAIALAYFISKYITRSLKTISDLLNRTNLAQRNQKIYLDRPSGEIASLVAAYNGMIDELEESAVKLARSEREQAWREMAKQVAHEIKNPLTPMRLTVQSFQRKFDPDDPKMAEKMADFSESLIQQIDTMSNIASAFSNFAHMPVQKNESLDVVEVVKRALDIFTEDCIHFRAGSDSIWAHMDRTQLIRVVTNLVKNALQAVPEVSDPYILVSVNEEAESVKIQVADNGIGIEDDNREKVFEPKFTTKTSGMGLGLGMVKNIVDSYQGQIDFTSQPGKGTVFTVILPKGS